MKKTILIVGSGSREHALAWKLKSSPRVEKIFIAPGNPGTAEFGENVDIKVADIAALADFAEKNNIDLTVVGPEDPLALGIVDEFCRLGLKIWGPVQAAAQIESSKVFSKELMKRAGVPTAKFEAFTNFDEALRYVRDHFSSSPPSRGGWVDSNKSSPPPNLPPQGGGITPIVIKASGLALGKGVVIAQTLAEAEKTLREIMVDKIFGDSGSEVVIEEFLEGMEFSTHAFCDGKTFKLLPSSQDHKRIFDSDRGPNTGGVGTIAPLPWVTDEHMTQIAETIVAPILKALADNGTPFTGLLYPGLMMTSSGPKVIEFNCRFGGPECESYMRILKTDLLDILEASVDGNLDKINIEWHAGYACCIILCSKGYPGEYEKGKEISGIDEANKLDDIIIFHSGTAFPSSGLRPPSPARGEGNNVVTKGGRVLGVTATGDTLQSALDKAYSAIKLISFDGMHYRTDIGLKSLQILPPLS